MSGLYIHVPFCKQACSYCDFYFVTRRHYKEAFVNALVAEIESYRDTRFTEEQVETIYFGGGTPSLLSAQELERIMDAVARTFSVQAKEITLEMNPDDVSESYLNELKAVGISRASMGIQSFDSELLAFMHRAHTSAEALQCLELLAKTGFSSFTVDLIYGNPGQTVEQLRSDIRKVLAFSPPHISAYSLTIEPKTRLGKLHELGRLNPLQDDAVASQLEWVVHDLAEGGLSQYEVSNFSKPGKEAIHNSNYWNHTNYLSFGPSAHSFWWSEGGESAQRWYNPPKLSAYLNRVENDDLLMETLHKKELAEERIMLALRTKKGIYPAQLEERYGYSLTPQQEMYITRKREEGFFQLNERLALTFKGLKIADTLVLDLLSC
ncbi:MAG: radical SAM family heme chaperone HemW [Bacteroidota bacterium]